MNRGENNKQQNCQRHQKHESLSADPENCGAAIAITLEAINVIAGTPNPIYLRLCIVISRIFLCRQDFYSLQVKVIFIIWRIIYILLFDLKLSPMT